MDPHEPGQPVAPLTDEEQFAAFKAGCEAFQAGQEAFAILLAGHRDYLLKIIERKVHTTRVPLSGASDILQSTFLRVLRYVKRDPTLFLAKVEQPNFKAWLREVAIRQYLKKLRDSKRRKRDRRRNRSLVEGHDRDAETRSPSSVAAEYERAEAVQSAIGTFSEVDRLLLRLKEWQGYTDSALVELLDPPVDEAKRVQMGRRLKQLKGRLKVRLLPSQIDDS